MFCWVKASACFEISVPGVEIVVTDLLAASKNRPNARSAWSMVFSAKSLSSAGTSSFGSDIATIPLVVSAELAQFGRRRDYSPGRGGPLSHILLMLIRQSPEGSDCIRNPSLLSAVHLWTGSPRSQGG